jgi:quercetin dioxygenase-like cupin family protein
MTHGNAAEQLDLRSVFGLTAEITHSAEETGGAWVEMTCVADPGCTTLVHRHPGQAESYRVLDGTLEVLLNGTWHQVPAPDFFAVPVGAVHAFRNSGTARVRFVNRHEPALGFQAHLQTLDRLVREGKVRGTRDPRSLIYMSMSSVRHRPDVAVKPPQWVVSAMAMVGRALRLRLPE